jgi:L-ascorbate metabolism protein UlaG (beta-lactamase superfamily)
MRKTAAALLSILMAAAVGCSVTPSPAHPVAATENTEPVTLTYLGVAGWQLAAGPHTLLLDPYFARVDPDALAESAPLSPDHAAIDRYAPKRADVILVSHSHYDHLMDVPAIARATGAMVVGTDSTLRVAAAASVPRQRLVLARGGESFDWPPFDVRAVPALHSLVGMTSAPIAQNVTLPMPASAWNEGGTLQYVVKTAGRTVFFMSTANFVESTLAGTSADVAVVATGLREKIPDYTCRLLRALGQPKLVLPTHFDDHRKPLGDRPPPYDEETRQDLDRFAAEVHACSPATRVVVPAYFEPIPI